MAKAKCNGDCFNCVYDDCINDSNTLTESEKHDKAIAKARKKIDTHERMKAKKRQAYADNKEYYRQKNAEWRAKHPDYMKEYWRKRKEKLKEEKKCI